VGVLPPSPLRGVLTGILPCLPVFLVIKKGVQTPLKNIFWEFPKKWKKGVKYPFEIFWNFSE
jgi:hypothetical protein